MSSRHAVPLGAMEYHDFALLIESPAVKLVSSPQAPMILAFLHRAFKKKVRFSIPEGELRELLDAYLAELRVSDPTVFPQPAADYLNAWCDDRHGFIKKVFNHDTPEPTFELTSGSEKAIRWLETLRASEFVGTESRLDRIFKTLEEILENASEDKDARIERLQEKITHLQEEIREIEVTGEVKTFSPVQINERFQGVLAATRELLSDFRQVEDNFKKIAQEVAERHSLPGVTKGAVVGHMLDSFDALRQSPQGQSFYAFLNLLLSSERQETFHTSLKKVYSLEVLHEGLRRDSLLKHLIPRLIREGDKVSSSNQRIASNLRRVLHTTHVQERRRLLDLIREIQTSALAVKDNPPQEQNFLELDGPPNVFVTFSRDMWHESEGTVLQGGIETEDDSMDRAEVLKFQQLPNIELKELRQNLTKCFESQDFLTLTEVLDRFPPKYGMVEVMGYVMIAAEDEHHHYVDDVETDVIDLPTKERWNVPRVLFCKK